MSMVLRLGLMKRMKRCLFCKLYERMEGEGSECGVSMDEFYENYGEMMMGDWLVLKDNDGVEVMSFVKF